LYLSYDGLTDPLGQSQVIPYIEGLTRKGHQFTILSFEKEQLFIKSGKNISLKLSTYNIRWIPLNYNKKPPIFSTLYDVLRMFWKAKTLHKKIGFDLVHCRSYLAGLVGLWMKRKYNVPFLFDMRGFWADERVDGGLWNLKSPIYRAVYNFFKKKEKQMVIESDHIISLTNAGKNEILNWMKKWKMSEEFLKKITVIPCCVNTDLFDITKINEEKTKNIRNELGLKVDDIVLVYIGSIGTWYMLDEMLLFFGRLLMKNPNCKFLLLTNEPQKNIFKKAEVNNIPTSGLIVKWVMRTDIPNYLSVATYAIYFIKPVYSKIASSPTKQAELLAMGIPIITNGGVGDSDQIIGETQGGVLVHDFTNKAYDDKIETILKHKNDKIDSGNYLDEKFSLTHGVNVYDKVYDEIQK